MKPFTTQAHINSLQGKKDEITVLEKIDTPNQPYYIVEYRGVKCTAIFNWFTFEYYADDVYCTIKD